MAGALADGRAASKTAVVVITSWFGRSVWHLEELPRAKEACSLLHAHAVSYLWLRRPFGGDAHRPAIIDFYK